MDRALEFESRTANLETVEQEKVKHSAVNIRNLSKYYGDFTAVDSVSLDVQEGELLTLLGPSGSGKTTTLQTVAGFEMPSEGEIFIHGKSTNGIPPHRRNLGMVFQNYSLVPHMTVFSNVAFPLKIRKVRKSVIERKVKETLELVNLGDFAHRKPSELSGGQQQRVALARAFVYQPEVLLMDEPLSALDKKLREHLQNEVRHIHRTLGVTILFVTHDQEEALRLSDRIAVFESGNVVQCASGEELYRHPKNQFVASFLGNGNIFRGEVVDITGGSYAVKVKCGKVIFAEPQDIQLAEGDNVNVFIRPEYLKIDAYCDSSSSLSENHLPGTISERIFGGGNVYVKVQIDEGDEVEISMNNDCARSSSSSFEIGQKVGVHWRTEETLLFRH